MCGSSIGAWTRAAIVAGSAAGGVEAFGHPITPFKLECPLWYVQVGLEVNPTFGPHSFNFVIGPCPILPPPPAVLYWSTPATMSLVGLTIRAQGNSTHMFAPHAGEAVPAATWNFNIAVAAPGPPFGARERRVRTRLQHPGGTHVDAYGAVVGGLVGTVVGPSLAPIFVIIHGSVGRHIDNSIPPSFDPIHGGGHLTPPTGIPSPGNQDFPVGELLTVIDANTSMATMLLIIEGMSSSSVTSIQIRDSVSLITFAELLPQMQAHALGSQETAWVLTDSPLGLVAANTIAAGHGQMVVKFSPAVHPDAQIMGPIVLTTCPADMNGDDQVDDTDFVRFAHDYDVLICDDPAMPPNCPSDLNGDGSVDDVDFVLFAGAYDELVCA